MESNAGSELSRVSHLNTYQADCPDFSPGLFSCSLLFMHPAGLILLYYMAFYNYLQYDLNLASSLPVDKLNIC